MSYPGPDRDDFANVRSLNRAFLGCLRRRDGGRALREHLLPEERQIVRGLTDPAIRRLAAAPFLLLSLREDDAEFWSGEVGAAKNRSLFAAPRVHDDDIARLVAAALGFVWQLANRNAYALRIVCGAPLTWCEQIAECTLYRLLERAGREPDIMRPRRFGIGGVWGRLLTAGGSSDIAVRRAAHIAALQTMLTHCDHREYRRLAAAACRGRTAALKVAEKDGERARRGRKS